jgi:hypothetical protein
VEGPVGSSGGERRKTEEGEEEDEGTEVQLPDQERRGRARRRLQVEKVRPEGCQEQPPPKVEMSMGTRYPPTRGEFPY